MADNPFRKLQEDIAERARSTDYLGLLNDLNKVKQKITFQLYVDENTPSPTFPRIKLYVNPDFLQFRRQKQVQVA